MSEKLDPEAKRLRNVSSGELADTIGALEARVACAAPPTLTTPRTAPQYEYIASVLARHDPRAASGRTVVLHLGNGASMCALKRGRSIATTMGFTAVDGLPMGTRSGNLDPGVILYLMQSLGMDGRAIESLLYNESGLLGVSGVYWVKILAICGSGSKP